MQVTGLKHYKRRKSAAIAFRQEKERDFVGSLRHSDQVQGSAG